MRRIGEFYNHPGCPQCKGLRAKAYEAFRGRPTGATAAETIGGIEHSYTVYEK